MPLGHRPALGFVLFVAAATNVPASLGCSTETRSFAGSGGNAGGAGASGSTTSGAGGASTSSTSSASAVSTTSGTGGAGGAGGQTSSSTATTGQGGAGGATACMSCTQYFYECLMSGLEAPGCNPPTLCDSIKGAAAYLLSCLCSSCSGVCPNTCSPMPIAGDGSFCWQCEQSTAMNQCAGALAACP